MAKKTLKLRAWTKDDIRMLKGLVREKRKTTVIARKLKRTVGATYQQAHKLGCHWVRDPKGLIGPSGQGHEIVFADAL